MLATPLILKMFCVQDFLWAKAPLELAHVKEFFFFLNGQVNVSVIIPNPKVYEFPQY